MTRFSEFETMITSPEMPSGLRIISKQELASWGRRLPELARRIAKINAKYERYRKDAQPHWYDFGWM